MEENIEVHSHNIMILINEDGSLRPFKDCPCKMRSIFRSDEVKKINCINLAKIGQQANIYFINDDTRHFDNSVASTLAGSSIKGPAILSKEEDDIEPSAVHDWILRIRGY